MLRSLRWRVAFPYMVLLLLMMAFLTVYLSNYSRDNYLDTEISTLANETHLVAKLVEPLIGTVDGVKKLDPLVDEYARILGVRITLIDSQGIVLGESQAKVEEMENHLGRPEIKQALVSGEGHSIRYSHTIREDLLYTAVPIKKDGQVIGFARLAIAMTGLRNHLNRITMTFSITAVIALIAILFLATLITRLALQPLSNITDAAQRLANEDYSDKLIPSRINEINRLNEAFGKMAIQLRNKIEDLQTERSKMAAVLARMNDGVLMVDNLGNVQLLNSAAERMFRIKEADALGHTVIEVVRQHQLYELWKTCRQTGVVQSMTLEVNPDKLFLQTIATPFGQSLPGHVLLVFQDLTRQHRLETIRQDFISNVSHELRTPLASMKALVETLQDGALEDPPAAHRFVARMEVEIDSLTQMVQELLELSRIESGKVPLQLKPVSPVDLITAAVERMRLQAERAGLNLLLDYQESFPSIVVDAERMQQVFINLIHNAIKFTLPGGSIFVSVKKEENNIIFTIKDTGIGIPAEDLSRIFERFYKTDRARSGGGTGLGLSIARHTIEAHGGKIWAESIQNQGSTFYISLPMAR
jgi:two-component system phosphate regulon sensor histidine kinase PhoR